MMPDRRELRIRAARDALEPYRGRSAPPEVVEAALDVLTDHRERPLPPHGARARYRRGCRCEDCTRANSEYVTARNRSRRTPPGGEERA